MKDFYITYPNHGTIVNCLKEPKRVKQVSIPVVDQQNAAISKLEKEQVVLKEETEALSSAAIGALDSYEENEEMMRKQLFRLKKQNAHLEGRTNLLEQEIQKQQQWNQNVWKWILETKHQIDAKP